jgi:outer membrane translocation and assembly module TamA
MLARCLLPVLSLSVVFIPFAMGQLPKRVESCLPYPTLAQEIREMQAPEPERPQVSVRVVRVEFNPEDGIPASVRGEVSTQLRSQVFEPYASSAYLKELAEDIAEIGVIGELQNRGYVRAKATVNLTVLGSKGADIDVAATIGVTPGTQYRTGKVQVESADDDVPLGISATVLRGLIPLQKGAFFSAEKVRMGMQNLTRAYNREGYVDMVSEPRTAIDDALKTVDLVYRIDQGPRYRVGSIEILGMNTVTEEKLLKLLPKPGEIFDPARLEEFLTVNRAILPSDASRDDVGIRRDVRTKTVAVLLDFRTCPL